MGRVCVVAAGEGLRVRYEAAAGWKLLETHLAVSGSLEGFPLTESHVPKLGHFPHATHHDPTVERHTYRVDLGSLGVPSREEVLLAAHVSVVNDQGVEEGAWAEGTRFREEGMPATYFSFDLSSR